MSALVPIILLGAFAGFQEAKTFRDDALGILFQHPASWTVKEDKYAQVLTFPAADGSVVEVAIYRMQFRQDPATWRRLQSEVAQQLGQRVRRQWEEQILGVPLLLSRVDFAQGEKQMSVLVGLLYTATKEKFNFRVTSTAAVADQAEKEWRDALVSLRTTNGELPVAEDPAKPLPNATTNASGQSITTLRPDAEGDRPVRTKFTARFEKLGLKLDAYLPEGWTLEPVEDKLFLQSAEVSVRLELVVSAGGKDELSSVLKAANNESFAKFARVGVREDSRPAKTKAGATVTGTVRVGTDREGKDLVAWHIVGTSGTIVWRLDYACASLVDYGADRKALDKLRDLFIILAAQ